MDLFFRGVDVADVAARSGGCEFVSGQSELRQPAGGREQQSAGGYAHEYWDHVFDSDEHCRSDGEQFRLLAEQ
jgi:hypothetical protein